MEKPWTAYLSAEDRAVYEACGHGGRTDVGTRPALLVVDVTYGFCGDRPQEHIESIRKWRNSCGPAAWGALPKIETLVAAARDTDTPVIYTHSGARKDGLHRGSWTWKNRRATESRVVDGIDVDQIMPQVAPLAGDIVLSKLKPSAFFGTPLASILVQLAVDTVIITGATTSGCVRASVIDAFSLNYKTVIAEDGVFDRYKASHAINLFDLSAKYAELRSSTELVAYMQGCKGKA